MYVYVYIHTQTRTHTYTVEYNSAIKKNEILPFAGARMDSEVITLSKVNQAEKCCIRFFLVQDSLSPELS